MGSGEMSASMVEVHKYAMSLIEGPVQAAFIDTPAGFQLNTDLIAQKAVEFSEQRLNVPMAVASFKDARLASLEETQRTVGILHDATYIFAGPGSPTYTIRNWRHTPVLDAIFETLTSGGSLTFASAASLTVGSWTIPVYEIYKVGEGLRWVEGLNILGHSGMDVAVVPHWNNTSGGDHDTRYCFMGQPRWQVLEAMLPSRTAVLGIDEHTACILRIDSNVGEVRGLGQVTVWRARDGALPRDEMVFLAGDSFSLELLRPAAGASRGSSDLDLDLEEPADGRLAWQEVRQKYEGLIAASHPPFEDVVSYIYDLMALLSQARRQQEWQSMQQAEEALREALVRILARLGSRPLDTDSVIAPYANLLLAVRDELRAARQWALADRIRGGLAELGLILEDRPEGTTWSRRP
jgi:cyanophycinase-like exopeptidase